MFNYSYTHMRYELQGKIIISIYKDRGSIVVQDSNDPNRVIVAGINLDSVYVK